MNKNKAKKIAEVVTIEQLREMFDNAKNKIDDWEAVSSVNKSMTKGTAWNILSKGFLHHEDSGKIQDRHRLGIKNMIWEFGDYLDLDFLQSFNTKKKHIEITPVHQVPDFLR